MTVWDSQVHGTNDGRVHPSDGRICQAGELVPSASPSTRAPGPGYLPSPLLFRQGCGTSNDRPLSGLACENL